MRSLKGPAPAMSCGLAEGVLVDNGANDLCLILARGSCEGNAVR